MAGGEATNDEWDKQGNIGKESKKDKKRCIIEKDSNKTWKGNKKVKMSYM